MAQTNYIVRKGDNLSKIALQYEVDWRDIASENNIKNPNLIHEGQQLLIPDKVLGNKAPSSSGTSSSTGSTGSSSSNKGTSSNNSSSSNKVWNYKEFEYDDFAYDKYKESDAVEGAGKALDAHLANKPGEYQSQWQAQLDGLMNQIMNRDKFSYDLNGDALYQQYKDKYIQQGKLAMGDAIGQASAMTGGYGNSYAQSVGQQAYQAQLDNLNDIVPELYAMALDQNNREGQELYNQYGMVADRENLDYGRYRDTVSDFLTERDYLQGRYDSERDFDYSKYNNERDFAYGTYADDRNLAYNEYATDKNLSYEEYRNAIADAQWQKEYDESVRQYNEQMKFQKQQYEDSKAPKTPANDPIDNTGDNKTPTYDNGGLKSYQIKELQAALGVGADGKWGPNSTKAAGGLSAKEAWDAYQAGKLGKKDAPVTPAESDDTTAFINRYSDKSRYLQAGHTLAEWNEYIEDRIASSLRDDRLSDSEALYLIQYYGLS